MFVKRIPQHNNLSPASLLITLTVFVAGATNSPIYKHRPDITFGPGACERWNRLWVGVRVSVMWFFRGKCHHIWFNWRRFQMQMTAKVNQRGTYTHVGFINNDHTLVCVRTACARLINMHFLVLNFIRRTKYRTFSLHCWSMRALEFVHVDKVLSF